MERLPISASHRQVKTRANARGGKLPVGVESNAVQWIAGIAAVPPTMQMIGRSVAVKNSRRKVETTRNDMKLRKPAKSTGVGRGRGERMDDVGTQILDAIYDQLKVEDEWALRRQRGFTWWSYRIAQHIDVSPPVHDRYRLTCATFMFAPTWSAMSTPTRTWRPCSFS